MSESLKEQRMRLGAGLLGCAPGEARAAVQSLPEKDLRELSERVDWLVEYEAEESA